MQDNVLKRREVVSESISISLRGKRLLKELHNIYNLCSPSVCRNRQQIQKKRAKFAKASIWKSHQVVSFHKKKKRNTIAPVFKFHLLSQRRLIHAGEQHVVSSQAKNTSGRFGKCLQGGSGDLSHFSFRLDRGTAAPAS